MPAPTPSTFSYAQAARGQSATHQAPPAGSNPTPPAPPSTSSMGKDDVASLTATSATGASSLSVASDVGDSLKAPPQDADQPAKKSDSDEAPPAEEVSSSTGPNGSVPAAAAPPPASARENHATDSSDTEKATIAPDQASRAGEDPSKKGRKPKKEKTENDEEQAPIEEEAEKPKEIVKVELSEAPVPTVNPWAKRMEAQAAKAKGAAPQAPKLAPVIVSSAREANTAATAPPPEEPKKHPVGDASEATASPMTTNGRNQRRSSEPVRHSPEQPRRNGPRGGRAADKDDPRSASEALPPVDDAALWPTPDSAPTSGTTKQQKPAEKTDRVEKEGQDESGPVKPPRQKEKWVPMDFTPSVSFSTPIPNIRGSKTRGRGGREPGSRGGQGGMSGPPVSDRMVFGAGAAKGTSDGRDRTREGSFATFGASKQRVPTDPLPSRDHRKGPTPAQGDRLVSESSATVAKGDFGSKGVRDLVNGSSDQHPARRTSPGDRRQHEHGAKPTDFSELPAQAPREYGQPARERVETRGERGGRGGYRGRGGHPGHLAQNHGPHLGYGSNGQRYSANAGLAAHQASTYSPPTPQYPFGDVHAPAPGRGGRGGRGFTSGRNRNSNGGNQISVLQTQTSPMADYPAAPYSAFPNLNPYTDPKLVGVLIAQVEYYFSKDNLAHDLYLRKMMDSQGFVPLMKIAEFPRMKALAPSIDFVRIACEHSDELDYVLTMDNVELVRSRNFWDKFVFPEDTRSEESRRQGPNLGTVYFRSAHAKRGGAWSAGPHPMMPPMFPANPPAMLPTGFAPPLPNGNEYPLYTNGTSMEPMVNGTYMNGHGYTGDSQLSATVPDFAPGSYAGAPTTLEGYQNLSDDQANNLMVPQVTPAEADPTGAATQGGQVHNPEVNGVEQSGSSSSGTSEHASSTYPEKPLEGNSASPPKGSVACRYAEFLPRAFNQRKLAKPGETPKDMLELYAFWHQSLLTQGFNVGMYENFRMSALEDACSEVPRLVGLNHLLSFYGEIFSTGQPFPAIFTRHQMEAQQQLPGAQSAMTNGEHQGA